MFSRISFVGCLFLSLAGCDVVDEPVDAPDEEESVTSLATGTVVGRARVIDGDTLYVDGIKIRLNGIDAPERGQYRFSEATRALQSIVSGEVVECQLNGDRTYDRLVGSCFVNGTDVAAYVISTGNALDCLRYSGGRYRKVETLDARRYIRQATYC